MISLINGCVGNSSISKNSLCNRNNVIILSGVFINSIPLILGVVFLTTPYFVNRYNISQLTSKIIGSVCIGASIIAFMIDCCVKCQKTRIASKDEPIQVDKSPDCLRSPQLMHYLEIIAAELKNRLTNRLQDPNYIPLNTVQARAELPNKKAVEEFILQGKNWITKQPEKSFAIFLHERYLSTLEEHLKVMEELTDKQKDICMEWILQSIPQNAKNNANVTKQFGSLTEKQREFLLAFQSATGGNSIEQDVDILLQRIGFELNWVEENLKIAALPVFQNFQNDILFAQHLTTTLCSADQLKLLEEWIGQCVRDIDALIAPSKDVIYELGCVRAIKEQYTKNMEPGHTSEVEDLTRIEEGLEVPALSLSNFMLLRKKFEGVKIQEKVKVYQSVFAPKLTAVQQQFWVNFQAAGKENTPKADVSTLSHRISNEISWVEENIKIYPELRVFYLFKADILFAKDLHENPCNATQLELLDQWVTQCVHNIDQLLAPPDYPTRVLQDCRKLLSAMNSHQESPCKTLAIQDLTKIEAQLQRQNITLTDLMDCQKKVGKVKAQVDEGLQYESVFN